MKEKETAKRALVKDVMAKGFSARKAAKAVDAVFGCMKYALWCGETVEIPGGTIESKIRKGRPRTNWHRFRNVQTGEIDFAMVKYLGCRRVVKFTPDLNLDLTPPPPLETAEEKEARQLASDLLGKPADQAVMAMLQRAIEFHPQRPWERLVVQPRPGTLLRRLQFIKRRGLRFDAVNQLVHELGMHYWV